MNKTAAGCLLAVAGLVGLYFKVEYSGWVLFIGILLAM